MELGENLMREEQNLGGNQHETEAGPEGSAKDTEKKWQEKGKQSQETMISHRRSKEHVWPAAVKATSGTRRMRSGECPGDPARRRSLVTST